jgi:arsenite methyltransferase
MAEQLTEIREHVRERYAAAAREAAREGSASCCESDGAGCGCGPATADPAHATGVFGAGLYGEDVDPIAATALQASLGCGNPTAIAELREGETVLDLGSGAGGDVLLSAKRVGPSGGAYGLDMTDEMLQLARRNAREAGVGNVEFLKGEIEAVPLPDASVDVVISNCVINLSGDKPQVLREAARVLRPAGRFAVSDVIADEDMDEATRSDMQQWTGCVAGALTRREYEQHLRAAGFDDVDIAVTHRVHEHAASATIRARRPV